MMRASFVLAAFVLPNSAFAGYTCYKIDGFGCNSDICRMAPGDSRTYHVVEGNSWVENLNATEEAIIEDAADAWAHGSGKINRGADWEFERGPNRSQIPNPDDSVSEVLMPVPDRWSWGGTWGVTVTELHGWPTCGNRASDVYINPYPEASWSYQLPNSAAGPSLPWLMIHEFGHVLGFDEMNDASEISLMRNFAALDISAQYRIGEHDNYAVQEEKSDSSTGRNLMLMKFENGVSSSEEVWTNSNSAGENWSGCPSECVSNPPAGIYVHLTGTSSVSNNEIDFWLKTASAGCGASTNNWKVGREPIGSMGVHTAYQQQLSPFCVPSNTPAGLYKLCAKVDPDNEVSEPSGSDNFVISDRDFWVKPPILCP